MNEKPFLLTVSEVSRILRIRRAKVYLLIECGTIEAFKIGCDWRIKTDSVERAVGPIPCKFFNQPLCKSGIPKVIPIEQLLNNSEVKEQPL